MSLLNIKIGDKAPEIVNTIIECQNDSRNKYEIDKDTGMVMLDRVLFGTEQYPVDYGYSPETLCEDGDPIDIIIIPGPEPIVPGAVARVRPVAMLEMIDDGEQDNKILGVYADNVRFAHINHLEDVRNAFPHLLKEIQHFFSVYKDLQDRKVQVGDWKDAQAAKDEIVRTQEMYQKK